MNRPLLYALGLAASALLVIGVWFATQGDSEGTSGDIVLLGPGSDARPEATEVSALDAPRLMPRETSSRSNARDEVEDDEPEEVDPRAPVPSDAIWIEGRVIEPDGLPPGDQLYVSAKGKTYDTKIRRKTHEVKVKPDGTFRVALAKGTRLGWLNVRSRFAYLEESYKVKPRDLEDEIILKPVLGGVLRGEVIAPTQLAWAKDPLKSARAELIQFGRGMPKPQLEDLNGENVFEFLALPPGEFDENSLSVRSDFLQRGRLEKSAEVKPGEVTNVRIELRAGARIQGTLLDDKGKVVPDGKIELSVTADGASWGGWLDRQKLTADDIDSEGKFTFYGVRPGKITLTASATGYRDDTIELGEVSDGEQRMGVALVVDQGRSISGMVRWPDGRPGVGAVVQLEQESDMDAWAMWEAIPSVRTDETGSFEITGLTVDGTCRVVATLRPDGDLRPESDDVETDSGRTARRKPRPHAWRARKDGVRPGNSDLILTLDSGASISGRVVNDIGEPVTRFHVTATPVNREMSRIDWETRTGTTVLVGDGSFKLEGIQDGMWNLFAASDGHVQSEQMLFEIPHDGSELVVICPRAAEIRGEVRNPAGELVVGATVRAKRITRGLDGSISEDRRVGSDKTNSNGEFKLEDLQYGALQVSAQADGFASSDVVELDVSAGQEIESVLLRLRVGARLRIELHPALGEVEGREITLNQISGDYWEQHKTKAGGVVTVDGLDPGEYSVTLQSQDDSNNTPWELRNANEITENVELGSSGSARVILGTPPENPVLVTGRVTRAGSAVAGAVVYARLRSGGRGHAAETDAAGQYQVNVDLAGDYNFTISEGDDGGSIDFRREVPLGKAASFDFDLPTMSISGMITGPGGSAVSDVRVSLERVPADGDPDGESYGTRRVNTDDSGRYEFKTLQPGTYHLRAGSESNWRRRRTASRFAQGLVTNIKVEAGKSTTGVDLQLETPGTATGIVFGPDGEPVANAFVQAADESGVSLGGSAAGSTDSNGRFRLTGLPPGTVKLSAFQSNLFSEATTVKIYADQQSEVELRMKSR